MFSRKFVDAQESNETASGLMNLHNNEAGRRVWKNLNKKAIRFLKSFWNCTFLHIGTKITNAACLQMPWSLRIMFNSCLLETITNIKCCWWSFGTIIWWCILCQGKWANYHHIKTIINTIIIDIHLCFSLLNVMVEYPNYADVIHSIKS